MPLLKNMHINVHNSNRSFVQQLRFEKLCQFTANFKNFHVIVPQYVFITVVYKLGVQKDFTVILAYHVMYSVKWHTNAYFLVFVKLVGNFNSALRFDSRA